MAISSGVRPATPRPAPKKPQVSRRSFLRTAWLAGLGAAAAGFGVGTVYFLWPNLTPNPSKAPWYFLGLQELLRYFHPMVAGVTIPGIALLILMATPYFDKNPSMRPENRKLAILMFTMFLMFWAILVLAGSFFRGPSFEWVWPWTETCSTPIHPDKTCLFFEF